MSFKSRSDRLGSGFGLPLDWSLESGSGGVRAESGRKIRIEREVKGSIWMSLVATPSVNEGFGAKTDSSGRVVTPNRLESSCGVWIRFCNRCFKRNLKNTLYNFTATLGISLSKKKSKISLPHQKRVSVCVFVERETEREANGNG